MSRIKGVCVGLWRATMGLCRMATVALLVVLLWFSTSFFVGIQTQYANQYDEMIREHERQLIVAEIIQSQQAWERTAEFLRESCEIERADAQAANLELEVLKYETYMFVEMLKRIDPAAYNDTVKALTQPTRSILVNPDTGKPEDTEDCEDFELEIEIIQ